MSVHVARACAHALRGFLAAASFCACGSHFNGHSSRRPTSASCFAGAHRKAAIIINNEINENEITTPTKLNVEAFQSLHTVCRERRQPRKPPSRPTSLGGVSGEAAVRAPCMHPLLHITLRNMARAPRAALDRCSAGTYRAISAYTNSDVRFPLS